MSFNSWIPDSISRISASRSAIKVSWNSNSCADTLQAGVNLVALVGRRFMRTVLTAELAAEFAPALILQIPSVHHVYLVCQSKSFRKAQVGRTLLRFLLPVCPPFSFGSLHIASVSLRIISALVERQLWRLRTLLKAWFVLVCE